MRRSRVHKRSGAEVATGWLGGRPVVLAKPRTYMNESGRHVSPLAKFTSVDPADVIVIHDELDIDFGRVRSSGAVAKVATTACGRSPTPWAPGLPTGSDRYRASARPGTAAFVLEPFTAAERTGADTVRAVR